jgi:hypothetical protein
MRNLPVENLAKSSEILSGAPCKIGANVVKSNEILRGPPCKIEAKSTKSNEILRGPLQNRGKFNRIH